MKSGKRRMPGSYQVIELDEQFHSYVVMASHSEKLHKVWKSLESGKYSILHHEIGIIDAI